MLDRFFLASIKNIGYICRPFASVAELVDLSTLSADRQARWIEILKVWFGFMPYQV